MITSPHFNRIKGKDTLSKNSLTQIHNFVETAKEFVRNGKTSHGRSFHCCFVLKHGKVQTIGFNSYKRRVGYLKHYGNIKHYTDGHYHMCLHAEVNAILKLGDIDFSKLTFLNVHLDKSNHCKASKPCLNCHRMMRMVGVKSCIYYDEDANRWLEIEL